MSRPATDHRLTIRFRLRSLLIVMAVAAGVFAAPRVYDYFYRARITRLSNAEANKLRLFGPSPIREMTLEERGGGTFHQFTAEYRSHHRSCFDLTDQKTFANGDSIFGLTTTEAKLTVEADDKETIEMLLAKVAKSDFPTPTSWGAIGIVLDSAGKILPDIMVGFTYGSAVHYTKTREDGTFATFADLGAKPLRPTERSSFHLRDNSGAWHCETPSFARKAGETMQVRITLPFELPTTTRSALPAPTPATDQ